MKLWDYSFPTRPETCAVPFAHHLFEDQGDMEDELRDLEKAWVLDKAEPITSSTPGMFQMFEPLQFFLLNLVSWAPSLTTERVVPEDKSEVSSLKTKQAHSEH